MGSECMCHTFFFPMFKTIKRISICQIKDQENCITSTVEHWTNTVISFLSSCIPKLELTGKKTELSKEKTHCSHSISFFLFFFLSLPFSSFPYWFSVSISFFHNTHVVFDERQTSRVIFRSSGKSIFAVKKLTPIVETGMGSNLLYMYRVIKEDFPTLKKRLFERETIFALTHSFFLSKTKNKPRFSNKSNFNFLFNFLGDETIQFLFCFFTRTTCHVVCCFCKKFKKKKRKLENWVVLSILLLFWNVVLFLCLCGK